MNFVRSFVNYAIFRELCDRMRFEVDCAKSHHRVISEGLLSNPHIPSPTMYKPLVTIRLDTLEMTFEYKLKVIAPADNFVSSRISFLFGCGLSASAGNLLKFFSCYCKKWPMRVIYRPEITINH